MVLRVCSKHVVYICITHYSSTHNHGSENMDLPKTSFLLQQFYFMEGGCRSILFMPNKSLKSWPKNLYLEPEKKQPFWTGKYIFQHPLLLGSMLTLRCLVYKDFIALCGLLVFLISIVASSQPSCFAASGLYLKGCGWNWSDPEVLLWGLATLQPFLYQLGEIIITDFSWSPLLPLFDCYGVLEVKSSGHGTMGFSNTGGAIRSWPVVRNAKIAQRRLHVQLGAVEKS